MAEDYREFDESPINSFGEDEIIAFRIPSTTPWGGGTPSSPVLTVKDATGTDVTADVSSGSATVSGGTIILPAISGLTAGQKYRLEVSFVLNGNTVEAWAHVLCKE